MKITYLFLVILMPIISLAQLDSVPSTDSLPPAEEYCFCIPEVMPLFPADSCLKLAIKKQKSCADYALMQYIYNNIVYPDSAKALGIEGTAVVQFSIKKDGTIDNIKMLRDPSGERNLFYQASMTLIKKMKEEKGPWIPGTQRGVPVDIRMNMPIRFKLEKSE